MDFWNLELETKPVITINPLIVIRTRILLFEECRTQLFMTCGKNKSFIGRVI